MNILQPIRSNSLQIMNIQSKVLFQMLILNSGYWMSLLFVIWLEKLWLTSKYILTIRGSWLALHSIKFKIYILDTYE